MQYRYALKAVNGLLLAEQIAAAGLPNTLRPSLEADALVIDVPDLELTDPQKAALDTVIANHDYTQLTEVQQSEATAEAQDATDRAQLQTLDDALATYIGLASPTAAQTVTAVKALCRFARYVIRRGLRKGWL